MNTPRSTSLTVPSTQNTALILEYRCLYTHDVRRKAKRWQDGFVRFHTFNKRVMVYDLPRNFVGDTHWRDNVDLADGDELSLDSGGVLVQVAEPVGKTQQDLTELLDKRTKSREQRQNQRQSQKRTEASSPLASSASSAVNVNAALRSAGIPSGQSIPNPCWRPKTLNALLGTPRGPTGRAIIPATSPFDVRGRRLDKDRSESAPKRRKLDQRKTAKIPADGPPVRLQNANTLSSRAKAAPSAGVRQFDTITIDDDDGHDSSKEVEMTSAPTTIRAASPTTAPPAKLPPFSPHRRNPQLSNREESFSPSSRSIAPVQTLKPPSKPLRMLPRSKRKKLLYQEDVSNTPDAPVAPPPPPPPPEDEATKFQRESQARVQARLQQKRPRRTRPEAEPSPPSSPSPCPFPPPIAPVIEEVALPPFDADDFSDDAHLATQPSPSKPAPANIAALSNFDIVPACPEITKSTVTFARPSIEPPLLSRSAESAHRAVPAFVPPRPRPRQQRRVQASPPRPPLSPPPIPLQQQLQVSPPRPSPSPPLPIPLQQQTKRAKQKEKQKPNPIPNQKRIVKSTRSNRHQDNDKPAPSLHPKASARTAHSSSVSTPIPAPAPVPVTGTSTGTGAGRASSKVAVDGPWSREAFDLFTWRPPGRIV
ncbi:MAG: hypothetical protein M1825_001367 [Sarcosagium campestre]|nr:MAG: hypothetical protein M1825_001367 [Sarcosagium campestre]